MAMRSLDRAIPKRKYRERHQPEARQALGYLEKHKDYSARARDFHRKEDELKGLREQAYQRNPEEFYFKMIHSQLKDGVHTEFEPPADDKTVKKRKLQDANVLLMRSQSQKHKLDRLKSGLHLLDQPLVNTHTVFVKDEQQLEEFDAAKYFDTDPALLKTKNRLKVAQLKKERLRQAEEEEDIPATDYDQYQQTSETADTLEQLLNEVEKDKLLLSKERKTLVDSDKRIYKFFRERKR